MQKFFDLLLDVIFPQSCIMCHGGMRICCDSCFLSLPTEAHTAYNITALYSYKNKIVHDLIYALKYEHNKIPAALFAQTLAGHIDKHFTGCYTILVPIPLRDGDQRLYNHAGVLAEYTTKFLDNVILADVLSKHNHDRQAHMKSRQEREENIKDIFSLDIKNFEKIYSEVRHKHPQTKVICIIIDDVFTTGSTLHEAEKILTQHFPNLETYLLTVAH